MAWIPCSISQDRYFTCAVVQLLVMAIKLSRYTSTSVTDGLVWAPCWWSGCRSIWRSKLRGSKGVVWILSMMSLIVFNGVQIYGRLLHQPICRLLGTTSSRSSVLLLWIDNERTYQKFHASTLDTASLQNSSLTHSFANRKGGSSQCCPIMLRTCFTYNLR